MTTATKEQWLPHTRAKRCPICDKPDRCLYTEDGAHRCFRQTGELVGYRKVKTCSDGTVVYRASDGTTLSPVRSSPPKSNSAQSVDWTREAKAFTSAMTPELLAQLATQLGVPLSTLADLNCGWASLADLKRLKVFGKDWDQDFPDGAYSFPERDSTYKIIGIGFRALDGRKGFAKDANRGLIMSQRDGAAVGTRLLVEGPSDVAACLAMGLPAIGRPSNRGGADHLAVICAELEVLVVGENDARLVEDKGMQWPGKDGAEAVATSLASHWNRPVKIAMPPKPLKDIRAWFNARVADPNDVGSCRARGQEMKDLLLADALEIQPPPPSLDIQIDRKPHRAKVTVTARVNGHIVHFDELSPGSDRRRMDFVNRVVEKEPRLKPHEVETTLLKAISEPEPNVAPVAQTREALLDIYDNHVQQLLDETPGEIIEQAEELMSDPNLLNLIHDHLELTGVVGEAELAFTTYLIGVSRLLPAPDLPLSGIAQGLSSTGKSYVMERASTLFPPEAVYKATDITAQALFYMRNGELMHRWVVAGERPRVQDDERAEATRALREMIASGYLSKAVTMKLQGGLQTVRLEQFGPIAYTESTTLTKIFDEDANRCIILQTDESKTQTRRIMKARAFRETHEAPDITPIQAVHHALQRMLMRVRVQVPFAEVLAEALPAERPEARRAFNHTLALIKSVALLHQRQRAPGSLAHGDVLQATVMDYRIAKKLLEGPLSRSLGGSIAAAAANLGRRLSDRYGGDVFTTAQAVQDDPVLKTRGKMGDYLNTLETAGVVAQVEVGKGSKPASWKVIGEVPMPGAIWLPDPEVLEKQA